MAAADRGDFAFGAGAPLRAMRPQSADSTSVVPAPPSQPEEST